MITEKEKYFKNYKLDEVANNSGKRYKRVYKYIGDYYSFNIPHSKFKKYQILFLVSEIISSLVFVFTALQRTPINHSAFCVIPALLAICMWIFEYIAIGFFCFAKYPLKEDDYKRINSTFYLTFIGRFFLLTITAVISLFLTFHLSLGINGLITFLGYLLCAIIALYLKIKYRYIHSTLKVQSNKTLA